MTVVLFPAVQAKAAEHGIEVGKNPQAGPNQRYWIVQVQSNGRRFFKNVVELNNGVDALIATREAAEAEAAQTIEPQVVEPQVVEPQVEPIAEAEVSVTETVAKVVPSTMATANKRKGGKKAKATDAADRPHPPTKATEPAKSKGWTLPGGFLPCGEIKPVQKGSIMGTIVELLEKGATQAEFESAGIGKGGNPFTYINQKKGYGVKEQSGMFFLVLPAGMTRPQYAEPKTVKASK